MIKKILLFIVVISQFANAQILSSTYDFEGLTTSAILHGQDNWVVGTNASQQNVGTTIGVGDYVGSKAFKPNDLGGNNFLFASRVNDGNWSIPSVTSCVSATTITMEASVAINYWGQHFNLGFDKNSDGDFGTTNTPDPNELGIGFGRDRSGGTNYMQVYKADGTVVSVPVAESLASYTWVRFRLVVELEGNSGQGVGALYYRNLETAAAWAIYPGLSNINMAINTASANQDNLSNLNGMAFVQEADRVYWDDLYVAVGCDGLLSAESEVLESTTIFAKNNSIVVDFDKELEAAITIFDVLGRPVLHVKTTATNNQFTVPVKGVYIVKVASEGQVETQKIWVN